MKLKCCLSLALLPLVATFTDDAFAQGFAAGISPSRFELEAEAGTVVRETVAILNPADKDAVFEIRTVDWELDAASSIQYVEDTLIENSCRPWVRLERQTLTIPRGTTKNYRFEVHVPPEATPGLCRFAIVIEPAEAFMAEVGADGLSLPVVGRYAVITYVTVGDAAPVIENLGLRKTDANGLSLPGITLRNTGTSHDRASGQVTVTDAAGLRLSLIPSSFPVLPGRTETLALMPETDERGQSPISLENQLVFPVTLRGRIEIGGQSIDIDATLE